MVERAQKESQPFSKFYIMKIDHCILLKSGLPPLWRAPLYLPVLQLIAHHRAISKGLNPDAPVNLSSVVVLHE